MMTTTSLDKLIQADQVIQVQQEYSKKIAKRSDKLDQRIRDFQKQLVDKKLKLEFEISQISDQHTQPFYQLAPKQEEQDGYDPSTGLEFPKSLSNKDQLIEDVKYIDMKVSTYDELVAHHEEIKIKSKRILNLLSKLRQQDELKALLANDTNRLPDGFMAKSKIKIMLRDMNLMKKILYKSNRLWSETIQRDQAMLGILESIEQKRNMVLNFN